MGYSILSRRDRIELENGMFLRLLSALELMQARRAASLLAEEEQERAFLLDGVAEAGETAWGPCALTRAFWPERWRKNRESPCSTAARRCWPD